VKKSSRRSKNLKAVLTQERERERTEREKRRLEKIENEDGMDVDGEPSIEEEIPTCRCSTFKAIFILIAL
jgi:INO80 complex subunit C